MVREEFDSRELEVDLKNVRLVAGAALWAIATRIMRRGHLPGFRHMVPKGTILLLVSCPMSARPNHGIPDLRHQ